MRQMLSQSPETLLRQLRREMPPGFDNRVRSAFWAGATEYSLQYLWNQIDEIRRRTPSVQFRHGRRVESKMTSQETLGQRVGRTQGTLSRWLTAGSDNWTNFLLTVTALNIELSALQLPTVERRSWAGYVAATNHIQRVELQKLNGADIGIEEVVCLIELFREVAWREARLIAQSRERWRAMRRAAQAIVQRASSRLGYEIDPSRIDRIEQLHHSWGEAWLLCRSSITVEWEQA